MRTHSTAYVSDPIASDLVDRETVALRLGVTSTTIRHWSVRPVRARGRIIAPIPCVPIVHRSGRVGAVLYYWPTVEAWARTLATIRRGTIPDGGWTTERVAEMIGGARER